MSVAAAGEGAANKTASVPSVLSVLADYLEQPTDADKPGTVHGVERADGGSLGVGGAETNTSSGVVASGDATHQDAPGRHPQQRHVSALAAADGVRPRHWAAVCALFSDQPDPDIMFTARAAELRKHPGQISFPGGSRDPEDNGPVGTALRETFEEVGLSAASVHVLGRLPAAEVVVSRFEVVPVVAWWSGADPLDVNETEVAAVYRWPVSLLADPAYRVTALHPSGFTGPAWMIGDEFLWGFTARIVAQLLQLGGWERPWDEAHQVPVPAAFMRDRLR